MEGFLYFYEVRIVDILEKTFSRKENNFSMARLSTHRGRVVGFCSADIHLKPPGA